MADLVQVSNHVLSEGTVFTPPYPVNTLTISPQAFAYNRLPLEANHLVLTKEKIVAFIPTVDLTKARSFYEEVLGLHLISQDDFAMVFGANGTTLRVTRVQNFHPQPFTILGWNVVDLDGSVSRLSEQGVKFENYGFPGQDQRGIWKSPNGARIAWFKDPDGNVLSLGSSR